jgi:hypothetical protein
MQETLDTAAGDVPYPQLHHQPVAASSNSPDKPYDVNKVNTCQLCCHQKPSAMICPCTAAAVEFVQEQQAGKRWVAAGDVKCSLDVWCALCYASRAHTGAREVCEQCNSAVE